MRYSENDRVTVHSLGSSYTDKEYRAIVHGISFDGPVTIYILEMVDKFDPAIYPYSCCTMPEGCLRKDW